MKKILSFLIFTLMIVNLYSAPDLSSNDYKLIMSSQNMKDEKEELMDINKVSEQDMLARKVSKSYVSKIIEYREITGGFDKLEDMKRIKGIGDATYQKLSKVFKVSSAPAKKMLNINSADDITLRYYGFSKNEIKKIKKYLDKNGRITDNIEFKKIVNKKTYEKLKDLINYEGEKK
ncbi:ComEA family DNA-binding protein [Fusobacterium simiae]|uniref:ComEA family DNA-binding protein n=1 Tax=Fusobacterium TaxID=848 RepID=UPI000408A419|nr:MULTISPECIES: ComEA family DNA-binding protein [Fusobacterium]MDC7954641.1 ComEA family DNA-binding protein [Fusobacterium simiae]